MGSPKYGLASAMSDVVGGYEKYQAGEAEKEKAGQQSELNKMKLQEMRGSLEKENSKAALQLVISGDMEGAMAKYNAGGEDRMTELNFDRDSGLVSWTDGKGEEQAAVLPHLMAMVGLNPKDLETPEGKFGREKEMVEHKAKIAKKYGIGKGGKDSRTAYIKNLEFLMDEFTGGDQRKALELLQLSKSDPRSARTRILSDLRKSNETRRRKDKWSEEEMNTMASDSVTSFQQEMFDRLIPKQNGAMAGPGAAAPTPTAAPTEEQFDPNNPSALWR